MRHAGVVVETATVSIRKDAHAQELLHLLAAAVTEIGQVLDQLHALDSFFAVCGPAARKTL